MIFRKNEQDNLKSDSRAAKNQNFEQVLTQVNNIALDRHRIGCGMWDVGCGNLKWDILIVLILTIDLLTQ